MRRAAAIVLCLLALGAIADDKLVIRDGKVNPPPACPDARAGTAVVLRLLIGRQEDARRANAEAQAWLKRWQECGEGR